MVGAVLTGGASRRMGRTKALIELDGACAAIRADRLPPAFKMLAPNDFPSHICRFFLAKPLLKLT